MVVTRKNSWLLPRIFFSFLKSTVIDVSIWANVILILGSPVMYLDNQIILNNYSYFIRTGVHLVSINDAKAEHIPCFD